MDKSKPVSHVTICKVGFLQWQIVVQHDNSRREMYAFTEERAEKKGLKRLRKMQRYSAMLKSTTKTFE